MQLIITQNNQFTLTRKCHTMIQKTILMSSLKFHLWGINQFRKWKFRTCSVFLLAVFHAWGLCCNFHMVFFSFNNSLHTLLCRWEDVPHHICLRSGFSSSSASSLSSHTIVSVVASRILICVVVLDLFGHGLLTHRLIILLNGRTSSIIYLLFYIIIKTVWHKFAHSIYRQSQNNFTQNEIVTLTMQRCVTRGIQIYKHGEEKICICSQPFQLILNMKWAYPNFVTLKLCVEYLKWRSCECKEMEYNKYSTHWTTTFVYHWWTHQVTIFLKF